MLLNPILEKYLSDLEGTVRKLIGIYIERYEEEIITGDRVNRRLRMRMGNEYLPELNEAVVTDRNHIRHLGYRYHFQDNDNNL